MQFHIVQLGRYSSAITHYTGAQTTIARHTRKKARVEIVLCASLGVVGARVVPKPTGIRTAERNHKSIGAGLWA